MEMSIIFHISPINWGKSSVVKEKYFEVPSSLTSLTQRLIRAGQGQTETGCQSDSRHSPVRSWSISFTNLQILSTISCKKWSPRGNDTLFLSFAEYGKSLNSVSDVSLNCLYSRRKIYIFDLSWSSSKHTPGRSTAVVLLICHYRSQSLISHWNVPLSFYTSQSQHSNFHLYPEREILILSRDPLFSPSNILLTLTFWTLDLVMERRNLRSHLTFPYLLHYSLLLPLLQGYNERILFGKKL